MVILRIDVDRVVPVPAERDTIVATRIHRESSTPFALQLMEPVSGKIEILRLARGLKLRKHAAKMPEIGDAEFAAVAHGRELTERPAADHADHAPDMISAPPCVNQRLTVVSR